MSDLSLMNMNYRFLIGPKPGYKTDRRITIGSGDISVHL